MLEIDVKSQEFFDERTNMFLETKPVKVKLAHSLISISKWEGIWKKPFFPSHYHEGMTGRKEEISYIECMLIGTYQPHIPATLMLYYREEIFNYMNDSQTATTIHRIGEDRRSRITPTITSEVIYSWMINYNIPFECDKWHFSRLITLIDVCNVQANKDKKSSRLNSLDSARYRNELNKARRAAYAKDQPT